MAGTDIDLCRPAVHQVVAFKEFPALGLELREVVVHILGFVLVQGDGHTAQGIDAGIKGLHVHFDVMIHHGAEVIGDDLVHDLHGAQGAAPLITQGIGQGQLGRTAVALAVGIHHVVQRDIGIPEEGGHGDLFGFLVHRNQNHGIGVLALLPLPGILTNEQDVDDLAHLAVVRVGGLGLGGFRGNRFRLLGGVFHQKARQIFLRQLVFRQLGLLDLIHFGYYKPGSQGADHKDHGQHDHQHLYPGIALFRCLLLQEPSAFRHM